MSVNGVNASMSGLMANRFRQDVTANNVANVNTEGFQPSSARTTDAAYVNDIGQGVRVAGAYAPPRPTPSPTAGAAGQDAQQPSNVDMLRETTNRISAQNAYGANAAMFGSADEASRTLLDLKS